MNCRNCSRPIRWDDYYNEYQHDTGDPQCTDTFGNFLPTSAEPKKEES